jgi:hypothetical protein
MALGIVNDVRFDWIIDIGLPGPDRGEGGKYLLVPPGYDGPLPDSGVHDGRSKTTYVRYAVRAYMESNDPKPALAKDGIWIQTMPGKGWFTILRLYSPLAPFIDKSWQPSEVELRLAGPRSRGNPHHRLRDQTRHHLPATKLGKPNKTGPASLRRRPLPRKASSMVCRSLRPRSES